MTLSAKTAFKRRRTHDHQSRRQAARRHPHPERRRRGSKPVTTDEFFGGKKVALFALPGAFTPTCSAKHLPGFKQLASEIKGKGVDVIACLSVNDAFVMRAWTEDQAVEPRTSSCWPTAAATFAKALGLEMDGSQVRPGPCSRHLFVDRRQQGGGRSSRRAGGEFRAGGGAHAEPALNPSVEEFAARTTAHLKCNPARRPGGRQPSGTPATCPLPGPGPASPPARPASPISRASPHLPPRW